MCFRFFKKLLEICRSVFSQNQQFWIRELEISANIYAVWFGPEGRNEDDNVAEEDLVELTD